jgi:hypothetical protein
MHLQSPCLVMELTTPSSLTTPSPITVTFTMLITMISGARNGAYTSSELHYIYWAFHLLTKAADLLLRTNNLRWSNYTHTWREATWGNTLIQQLCAPASCKVSVHCTAKGHQSVTISLSLQSTVTGPRCLCESTLGQFRAAWNELEPQFRSLQHEICASGQIN